MSLYEPNENEFMIARELSKAMMENRRLQRMLGVLFSGYRYLYTDDGEFSDSRHPTIDWMRDTPFELKEKMRERNQSRMEKQQEEAPEDCAAPGAMRS